MMSTLSPAVRKHGTRFFQRMGSKGGQTTLERYGTEYYRLLGLLGGNHLSKTRETKIRRAIRKVLQPY